MLSSNTIVQSPCHSSTTSLYFEPHPNQPRVLFSASRARRTTSSLPSSIFCPERSRTSPIFCSAAFLSSPYLACVSWALCRARSVISVPTSVARVYIRPSLVVAPDDDTRGGSYYLGLIIISLDLFFCTFQLPPGRFPDVPHLLLRFVFLTSRSFAINAGLSAGVVIVQSSEGTKCREDNDGVATL